MIDTYNNLVPVCRAYFYQDPRTRLERSEAKSGASGSCPDFNKSPFFVCIGKNGTWGKQADAGKLNKKDFVQGKPSNWQLLQCRVNRTRQWSASSFDMQVALEHDVTTPPSPPPIRPRDYVIIEMGYCKSLDTNITNGNNLYCNGLFKGSVVFYGIVDTVKERGGSGENDGIVFSVKGRDMCAFLIDNKIRGQYSPLAGINRAFIIRDMILKGAAIDYIEREKDANGQIKVEDDNFGYETSVFKKKKLEQGQEIFQYVTAHPKNCYVKLGIIEKSQRHLEPPDSNDASKGMVIMDKFPMDVIKHFSLVETHPRELFCSQYDGSINWMYRRTDMRVLGALMPDGVTPDLKKRQLRQYFYRIPQSKANILSYTMEWTTAGTVTNFTIMNPINNSAGLNKNLDYYVESPLAQVMDPHTGKPLNAFTVNRFVYDDTLTNLDQTEVIAHSLFNIWGRAIQAGMVMIPGDPSLDIGEAVQIFNTGLFGRRFDEQGNNQDGNNVTTDGSYSDRDFNPEGIYRVEGITHIFATGGIGTGFRTVFLFGPRDEDTSGFMYTDPDDNQKKEMPPRLIKTDADYSKILQINNNDYLEGSV